MRKYAAIDRLDGPDGQDGQNAFEATRYTLTVKHSAVPDIWHLAT